VFPNPFRKAPDKKPAGKAGSKPKSGGKSAAGRGSGASGARAKPKGRGAGAQRPMQAPGLSLDRKLDIIGIVLVFTGLLTGLSLFSANNSDIPFLTAWLSLNRQIAGWGVFGLPLGFIAIGLWLVLRKFGDRLPKLEYERLVGLVLRENLPMRNLALSVGFELDEAGSDVDALRFVLALARRPGESS